MKNIECYICFSVADLKRFGLFGGGIRRGVLEWGKNSTGIVADNANDEIILFFNHNGESCEQHIKLYRQRSNLNGEQFYYYFICPKSKTLCRKLYLVDGAFIGRKSFKHIYERQANHRHKKRGLFADFCELWDLVELRAGLESKHRRETYNGNLTPYGKRMKKYGDKIIKLTNYLENVLHH